MTGGEHRDHVGVAVSVHDGAVVTRSDGVVGMAGERSKPVFGPLGGFLEFRDEPLLVLGFE